MNFALLLLVLTVVTGFIALLDQIFLASKRKKTQSPMPKWIEHSRGFFPIFLIVFLLRSFIVEPFRIPSGSLKPTLKIGDFVAVNKFAYGLRFPIGGYKLLSGNMPHTGDIIVFSWPPNTKFDFIKRVIGVPGDVVTYKDKVLYINGKEAKQKFLRYEIDRDEQGISHTMAVFRENLMGVSHNIYVDSDVPAHDFTVKVPQHSYLAMGDNRDFSSDSRFWGFVPEYDLKGKAFGIWMSWDSDKNSIRWSRIGQGIH